MAKRYRRLPAHSMQRMLIAESSGRNEEPLFGRCWWVRATSRQAWNISSVDWRPWMTVAFGSGLFGFASVLSKTAVQRMVLPFFSFRGCDST